MANQRKAYCPLENEHRLILQSKEGNSENSKHNTLFEKNPNSIMPVGQLSAADGDAYLSPAKTCRMCDH